MIYIRSHFTAHCLQIVVFCLLLAVCCLPVSCGKKGDLTLKAFENPDPATGLRAIHRESEIILFWDFPKEKESAIKGFHLLKASGGDFEHIMFLEEYVRMYRDIDFHNGSAYQYKIVTESLKGIFADSQAISIAPVHVPSPPAELSYTIDNESLSIRWNSAGEGIAYNIYRSYKQGSYPLIPLNNEPVRGISFNDVFSMHKIVYYTVRSTTGSTIRDEGPASEEITVNPSEFIPPAPESLQAVPSKDRVYLLWKEPKESWITGYRVYRQIHTQDAFLLIGESRVPSFIDSDNPSQKRNYRVTVMGPAREGPPAEIRNVFYTPR